MDDQDFLSADEIKILRQMMREFLAKRTKKSQEQAKQLTAELARANGPLRR